MDLSLTDANSLGQFISSTLKLEFHSDIQSISNPKIYRGNPGLLEPMDNRRLVFYNLPSSITTLQVARAAAPFGQVIRVNLIADVASGTLNNSTTRSVLVEFASQDSAYICAAAVNSMCQTFISATGEAYVVGIWVIPTLSFTLSVSEQSLLQNGYTRTIEFSPIAVECVWFTISAIADRRQILDVDYDVCSKTITIEFASLDASHQAILALQKNLLFLVFNSDEERMITSRKDPVAFAANVHYLPPNYLEQRFDRAPYNSYWPDQYCYVMSLRNLQPRRNEDVEETDTDENDSGEATKPNTNTATPNGGGDYLTEADVEEMAMPGNWDDYFQTQHTIRYGAWAKYARVARHRRELSAAQGLAPGVIPHCDGQCEFECKSIKDTPPPEVVHKYLRSFTSKDVLIPL
ncbi:hypothetical protein NQ176_g855 [Zarea fungicola]|uniref:Uncharacterized protein n=1 Tax=Zarea fungicola TaxID=93591 RepID=A0ACC1NXC7_9HYPO|nr:hypothetical protein NQ176_g855 [Lecanicillium fungicola]